MQTSHATDRNYTRILWLLSGVFLFRVVAQPLALLVDFAPLPVFDAWHSGLLPYSLLFASQLLILALMFAVNLAHRRGRVTPCPRRGKILLIVGMIYLLAMITRLGLGAFLYPDHPWFGNRLSPLFHLVLAGYLLTLAGIHLQAFARIEARLHGLLPWVIYPAGMTAGLFAYHALSEAGAGLLLSAYLPVLCAAAFITLFERALPERKCWHPRRAEVKQDFWFMGMVQLLLPKLVSIALIVMVAEPLSAALPALSDIWPHEWHLAAQVALMLLTVEFGRYWLHRAAHTWSPLWRLHAVHHSPKKLYWFNVGRFHPLEKVLQMLLDTLPFLLLSVSEALLGAYFVFYAVNGFFQHSNIKLRNGLLNYVISGAELHRWHHSRETAESNRNYGNNLIVWDLLFGTWYLPKETQVGELGLINRAYPMSFMQQMFTPLAADLHQRPAPLPGPSRMFNNALRQLTCALIWLRDWRPFVRATHDPLRAQQHVLRRILAGNAATAFGTQHGFKTIESYADFARQVPVQTATGLRPYIEHGLQGGTGALTAQAAVFYSRTSGTTGQAKYLPATADTLKDYRRQQRLAAFSLMRHCRDGMAGKILAIVGAAVEGHSPAGLPFGSLSAYVSASMPAFIRKRYAVPSEVFDIEDYELKYKLIARFALQQRDITCLATANPSTLLQLQNVLREHATELAAGLDGDSIKGLDDLPPARRAAIQNKLRQDPARAAQVRQLASEDRLDFAHLWPSIRTVNTWTGGSCGIAVDALRDSLPEAAKFSELGYLASELRGSININPAQDGDVPTLTDNFFEFVEKHLWEDETPEFLTLDQLQNGREYYVIVTTPSGLYRYFMNDIVRVSGFYNRTPLIRFVQKGRGATNITGEKLYEGQIIEAIAQVSRRHDWKPVFALALADEHQARYRVYLETQGARIDDLAATADELDRALQELNIEYQAKRDSGRLGLPKLSLLNAGTADSYKRECVQAGQRDSQFKPQVLQYLRQLRFPIENFVQRSSVVA